VFWEMKALHMDWRNKYCVVIYLEDEEQLRIYCIFSADVV
jgi:hypothetical protein